MENIRPEFNDKTHVLTRTIKEDGSSEYEVTPLSEEAAALRSNPDSFRAISLAYVRAERDRRIKTTDWIVLSDIPIDSTKREEWLVYRQQLRDFPETCDPLNPIWPTQPK